MHAVIMTGGKQYRVKEGDVLRVEKLGLDEGAKIDFTEVLMTSNGDDAITVGTPHVEGATVSAEVMSNGRSKKVRIIKFKRRKHHMKKMGHRQSYSEIKITTIKA
ncbi:MAG: 50S ribosomal protein L21 [Alcanivoracaceae bacterium]|nr:50S ribosomal protein L21 [Alcanivoracaceae bacterium]